MDKNKISGSTSFKKLNPTLFPPVIMDEDDAHQTAKRVRQSARKMSQLEKEWGEVLRQSWVLHPRNNAMALRLANGVVYWPDWTGYHLGQLIAWEVKGKHAWDDATVKLKVAAGQYREIRFILVWKVNGHWKEQTILP